MEALMYMMKLSIGLKEAWKLDLQSISWALHEYTLSLKCSRWDPKMRYVYRHKDRRWQLLKSQTWRYNSPKLVFESPVLCSQCNLMLHIVLIHWGKSISLSDKPVNPLNSCEIHIALSFSCFIMYVTVPAHLDEQMAHFRCVHGKILNVLLKLHLSNSTLSRYEVQPGEQQLSKTSKPNKLSPFFFTTKTQMLKCIHIYIKYLSHTWMPQFAAYISSVQHTISLTATLVLAARQTLTYKHCSFSSPTTTQLLHLCNLLYGVSHPNGKCLWSLSPEARHSLNAPQTCTQRGKKRSVGVDRWGWWENRSREHPHILPAVTPGTLPPKQGGANPAPPTEHSKDNVLCHSNAQEEALWDGLSNPCCIPETDALKLRKRMGWNLVLIMLIGVL